MKHVYYKLLTLINRLDENKDCIIKVNWDKLEAIAIQEELTLVYINSITLVIEKRKGSDIYLLEPRDLKLLRSVLLTYLNESGTSIIVQVKHGCEVRSLRKINSNGIKDYISVVARFRMRRYLIRRLYMLIVNKPFAKAYKKLVSTK
jgi:hypothetical protein